MMVGEGQIDVAIQAHVTYLSQVFVQARLTYLKKVLQRVHQNGSLVESWTAKIMAFSLHFMNQTPNVPGALVSGIPKIGYPRALLRRP